MVLYYPLSSFLLLFANLLQNPQDSYTAIDLKLMELVTSFLTPSAVPHSPFSTPASIQMFQQLYRIVVKFVEKNNAQDKRTVKRAHCDIDSGESNQLHPITKSTSRDITVCILQVSIFTLHETCLTFHVRFYPRILRTLSGSQTMASLIRRCMTCNLSRIVPKTLCHSQLACRNRFLMRIRCPMGLFNIPQIWLACLYFLIRPSGSGIYRISGIVTSCQRAEILYVNLVENNFV